MRRLRLRMRTSAGPRRRASSSRSAGLSADDNGAITFSDGNPAHNVVVNIVNGAPVSTSVNLSGMTDGPITASLSVSDPAGNAFSAHASAQLDQDLNENPTLSFANANIGRAQAGSEHFTVAGLDTDDNGAITFSDGNSAHNVVVNIVNGAPVSTSVNLSGMTDGPISASLSVSDPAGNTFTAHASAQLDQDLNENPTLSFANANIGRAQAGSEHFTVAGLDTDDNGAITFSDGNSAHNVVVNIVNGAPVEQLGQPVWDDGWADHRVVVGERPGGKHFQATHRRNSTRILRSRSSSV